MASNTGCTSDGELAMTLRMSAVAVWRSSAARRRLSSLAVPALGLSACRLPDLGLGDSGRADWMAVGLRAGPARFGAFARFAAFRARAAICDPPGKSNQSGRGRTDRQHVVLTRRRL